MDRPYINRLRIQNYGCIKDLELELTPLHALIGPNDSGKSTVLMALRTLTRLAAGVLSGADDSNKLATGIVLNPGMDLAATVSNETWRLNSTAPDHVNEIIKSKRQSSTVTMNLGQGSKFLKAEEQMRRALAGSVLLRLDPDALRAPTKLIPEGQPLRFMNAFGLGLPAIYDAIVTRDLHDYMRINARLTELFPTVKSLSLKNPSDQTKALGVQLLDGSVVGADFMSEGMLYFLAYAALRHLEPTAVILVEEPENGLHPARIREVLDVLREISQTTQVILATHSPLVINELEPNEVTVLTRDPVLGTRGKLLRDTPNFAERSKVYALGELWVSYADGNVEAPLFTEPEAVQDPGDPVEWHELDDR